MAKRAVKRPGQGRPGPASKIPLVWGATEFDDIEEEWIRKGRAQWLRAVAKALGVPSCEVGPPMDREKVHWLVGYTLRPQSLGGGEYSLHGNPPEWVGGYSAPCREMPDGGWPSLQAFKDSYWPCADRVTALQFTYLFVTHPDEAAALWSFALMRWLQLSRSQSARARVVARTMHYLAHAKGKPPPTAKEIAKEVERRHGGRCTVSMAEEAIKKERRRATREKRA